MNGDIEEIIENANERISFVKTLEQNQIVVLTINDQGEVIHMHNAWNASNSVAFDPSKPCDFSTPVNKGKTITWIGTPYPINNTAIQIEIDYILLNNTKGKQILKNKSYNRGQDNKVVGRVKNKTFLKEDSEYYYIVYSVITKADRKTYILDPKMDPYGDTQ